MKKFSSKIILIIAILITYLFFYVNVANYVVIFDSLDRLIERDKLYFQFIKTGKKSFAFELYEKVRNKCYKEKMRNSYAIGLDNYGVVKDLDQLSDESLVEKVNSGNFVFERVIAFGILVTRKSPFMFSTLINNLKDKTIVFDYKGCLDAKFKTTSDFYLDFLSDYKYKFSEREKQVIEKNLLFANNINNRAQAKLLLKINGKYYQRIRQLVLEENNYPAIVALAKFKKKQDINIIIKQLQDKNPKAKYYATLAVKEFPDSSFLPFLIKIYDQDIYEIDFYKNDFYNPFLKITYQGLLQYNNNLVRKVIINKLNSLKKQQKYSLKINLIYLKYSLKFYQNNLFDNEKINFPSESKTDREDFFKDNYVLEEDDKWY